jgi:pimeloyl-ACP methyl ester carboxylesterase
MARMSTEFRYVEAGGHKTRLLQAGSGAPVVVLHGWGGRIESMSPVSQCLSAAFRVVALDLPGFGESPVPQGKWGTPDYAEYVRDVLVDEGIERAHFVGHSFGAKTSLYLAATRPELVDKLVVVGSPALRTPPSLAVRGKRLLSRGARIAGLLGAPGRAVRDGVYERIASQDYRDAGEMRPILVTVVNEDLTAMLARVSSPCLLVWGTNDDAVPLVHARRMQQIIPDAGLIEFEDAGHFAYLDEAQRFCRIVRHFFGAPLS